MDGQQIVGQEQVPAEAEAEPFKIPEENDEDVNCQTQTVNDDPPPVPEPTPGPTQEAEAEPFKIQEENDEDVNCQTQTVKDDPQPVPGPTPRPTLANSTPVPRPTPARSNTQQPHSSTTHYPDRPTQSCPYRELCATYLHSLRLHGCYFAPEFDMCYCEACNQTRGGETCFYRGLPSKKYGLPIGWCRFGLSLPPRATDLKVTAKWHRAYHGTKFYALEGILKVSELVIPGQYVLGGKMISPPQNHFTEDNKPVGFDVKKVFVSPSIRYAGLNVYAEPHRWEVSHAVYNTRVALQVFINPDSYDVGPQTVGARGTIDPEFSNDDIEWSTKEQGSTMLYGLLIKIDDFDAGQLSQNQLQQQQRRQVKQRVSVYQKEKKSSFCDIL